jgi:hypothetical protein
MKLLENKIIIIMNGLNHDFWVGFNMAYKKKGLYYIYCYQRTLSMKLSSAKLELLLANQ